LLKLKKLRSFYRKPAQLLPETCAAFGQNLRGFLVKPAQLFIKVNLLT
jgi:hypothetical protein